MADEVIPLFPTSLFKRRLPGMEEANRGLIALIRGLEASGPNASAGTSTRGGFQTQGDLLAGEHPQAGNPALFRLKQHLAQAIQDYASLLIRQECTHPPSQVNFTLWGWGVILRDGNWQGHHVHSGAHISGVYYIAAPPAALAEGQDDGKISFYDPRPRANMAQLLTQRTRHAEAPVPGELVIFPSWLEHSVAPFRGDGERICIAFNVQLALS